MNVKYCADELHSRKVNLTLGFHSQQTTDETMRNIYENMFDKNLPNTTLEGLKNLCSIKNYAFMTTYDTVLLFWKNANCSFMALKEASFPETLSIAFSKGSPYLGVINFK